MKKILALSLVAISTLLLLACDDSSQAKLDKCLEILAADTRMGVTHEEYEKNSKLFRSMKCHKELQGKNIGMSK